MGRILACFVFSLSISSILSHAHAAPLRIASSGLSGELLPLWIAQDRLIFKKHGLDTECSTIQGGPLAIQALVSGSVQFHAGGTSSTIEARIGGANTLTLAVFIDSLPYPFVSSPPVKPPPQQKEKR